MREPPPWILLFLKAPRPGYAKTRLAKELPGGDRDALRVYRLLVERQQRALPSEWPCRVYFTPAEARREMVDWLGPETALHPQTRGDLGERLAHAARSAFAAGAPGVILIGGDCPGLDHRHLQEAADLLTDGADYVVGPARDGGYYLLGLRAFSEALFRDIPWSTERVCETTFRRARAAGLRGFQLEILEDVDDTRSLARAIALGLVSPHITIAEGNANEPS